MLKQCQFLILGLSGKAKEGCKAKESMNMLLIFQKGFYYIEKKNPLCLKGKQYKNISAKKRALGRYYHNS